MFREIGLILLTHRNKRSWWNSTSPDREIRLFRLLESRSASFGSLLKDLRWGSQTLTFYLKTLEGKGCITSKRHGRNVTYTLIRSNPYVAKIMKLSTQSGQSIRILGRVAFDKLDGEAFVNDWLNSIGFSFLNLLWIYALLGHEDTKGKNGELHRTLQIGVHDLVDTIDAYGRILTERVKTDTIKLDKIKEIKERIRRDLEKRFFQLQHSILKSGQ